MDLGRVEKRNQRSADVPEEQRQLGTGQDNRLHSIPVFISPAIARRRSRVSGRKVLFRSSYTSRILMRRQAQSEGLLALSMMQRLRILDT